jgi:hypothetical protein
MSTCALFASADLPAKALGNGQGLGGIMQSASTRRPHRAEARATPWAQLRR